MSLPFPSLCSIANDHPFVPACHWQSTARSGRQGGRPQRGGTGEAGAQSVLERASTVLCPRRRDHRRFARSAGLPPRAFPLLIGGRSSPIDGEG
jgi:hypothetical protein